MNRRTDYLAMVRDSARAVADERRRHAGTQGYRGNEERGLEMALRMATSAGFGPDARAAVRAILRTAPTVPVSPGVKWQRDAQRAKRRASGRAMYPAIRNPAETDYTADNKAYRDEQDRAEAERDRRRAEIEGWMRKGGKRTPDRFTPLGSFAPAKRNPALGYWGSDPQEERDAEQARVRFNTAKLAVARFLAAPTVGKAKAIYDDYLRRGGSAALWDRAADAPARKRNPARADDDVTKPYPFSKKEGEYDHFTNHAPDAATLREWRDQAMRDRDEWARTSSASQSVEARASIALKAAEKVHAAAAKQAQHDYAVYGWHADDTSTIAQERKRRKERALSRKGDVSDEIAALSNPRKRNPGPPAGYLTLEQYREKIGSTKLNLMDLHYHLDKNYGSDLLYKVDGKWVPARVAGAKGTGEALYAREGGHVAVRTAKQNPTRSNRRYGVG